MKSSLTYGIGVALAASLAACGTKSPESEAPRALGPIALLSYSGFAGPERVLYDTERDRYLVSNVNGDTTADDDNGFISLLAPDGGVTNLKWIEGGHDGVKLSAPKGLTISNGVLYVTDITVVRRFDAETGAYQSEIPVPGATFLNGLSRDGDGTVYVSDSGPPRGTLDAAGTEAVYRLEDDRAVAIANSQLGRPTALEWFKQGLLVAPFGANEIYRLDASGTKRDATALPVGGLAGVVALGDWLYVSSWQASAIFRGKLGGRFEPVLENQNAPTDLGYDTQRKRLLIPHYTEDRVDVFGFE
jgi:hypothetical protein